MNEQNGNITCVGTETEKFWQDYDFPARAYHSGHTPGCGYKQF